MISLRDPHALLVSFCVEVGSEGTTDVLVIETDLHLNSRHPDYDAAKVRSLIAAAQARVPGTVMIRLVSNRSALVA